MVSKKFEIRTFKSLLLTGAWKHVESQRCNIYCIEIDDETYMWEVYDLWRTGVNGEIFETYAELEKWLVGHDIIQDGGD